jgi:hypothetical protein
MILTTEDIRNILAVKHDCTITEFMDHINLLGKFFKLENSSEQEILALLEEINDDGNGDYKIAVGRISRNRPVERLILQRRKIPEWIEDTVL